MVGEVKARFPGGCYLSFNWAIDRAASARLVDSVASAHTEGYEEINLLLSSVGGLLVDAHYAVECLAAIPARLVIWNTSAIQSAANMLFAVGIERYATPGSSFWFHQTGFEGVAGQRNSEAEVKEQLRQIQVGDQRSAAFIAERAGLSAELVMEWQRSTTTLTDVEALKSGYVHDVRRPVVPPDAFFRQVASTPF